MNGKEEGWSWGLPVHPNFMNNGQFEATMLGPDVHECHFHPNSEQLGVDQFTHSSERSGRSQLLGIPSHVPNRESLPIQRYNHENICKLGVRRFCCEGCVIRVQKRLRTIPGVYSTHCNVEDKTITVVGTADPIVILNRLQSIKFLDPKLLSDSAFTSSWSTRTSSSSDEISAGGFER